MLYYLALRVAGLRSDRRGQELLEYALIGGFVASAAACVLPAIAAATSTLFNAVTSVLSQALSVSGGQAGV